MNRNELLLLKSCIKKVIKSSMGDGDWEQLKDEIHILGYQSYYGAQLFLEKQADDAVFALSDNDKKLLILEWKRIPRLIKRETDEEILKQYAMAVVEKVVERARAVVTKL